MAKRGKIRNEIIKPAKQLEAGLKFRPLQEKIKDEMKNSGGLSKKGWNKFVYVFVDKDVSCKNGIKQFFFISSSCTSKQRRVHCADFCMYAIVPWLLNNK